METRTPAAETATPADLTPVEEIIVILKGHYSAGDGCSCGNAPEVFWERELHRHIGEVMVAAGWARQP